MHSFRNCTAQMMERKKMCKIFIIANNRFLFVSPIYSLQRTTEKKTTTIKLHTHSRTECHALSHPVYDSILLDLE